MVVQNYSARLPFVSVRTILELQFSLFENEIFVVEFLLASGDYCYLVFLSVALEL